MVVLTLNLLLQFYRPLFLSLLFVAQKVSKSSASEYNASLLADCKRAQPTLLKKAQHRQNHCLRRTSAALVASVSKLPLTRWYELSYRPFAHEFSRAKISLGWALLASNFSHRKTTRECASLAAPRRAKKTFTLLSAPFLCPLPVILTVLYFLKVTFALLIAKQK
jgi:hypothetical protein